MGEASTQPRRLFDLEKSPVPACVGLTVLCAGPSLVIGWLAEYHVGGMLAALALYFGALLVVATRPFARRAMRRPAVARAISGTVTVRLFAVCVYPIAVVNDVVCGALAAGLGHGLAHTYEMAGQAAADVLIAGTVTLIQGLLLTGELALVFWINYRRQCRAGVPTRPEGTCEHCGYDLRGTASALCPECGTPIL